MTPGEREGTWPNYSRALFAADEMIDDATFVVCDTQRAGQCENYARASRRITSEKLDAARILGAGLVGDAERKPSFVDGGGDKGAHHAPVTWSLSNASCSERA
jgi:hypothetical protein